MRIEAHDISYRVHGVSILEPLNLQLGGGRTYVLLGPNGAGKSTLLKLLSGSAKPSSGYIQFDEDRLADLPLDVRARRFGVLTQRNELDFPFTAREVVSMGRTPFGDERESGIADEMIEALRIQPDQRYTTLSGGEKQLVQLARVLSQVSGLGPRGFLYLDEPLTALDLRHQALVANLLRAQKNTGLGQLIVLHDINMAAAIADDVILMKNGQVIAAGNAEMILQHRNLESTFDTRLQVVTDNGRRFYRPDIDWRQEQKS